MKSPLKLATLGLCALGMLSTAFGADVDWYRKIGAKRQKKSQRYTSVAAVRGVEEPGDVDPEARDMEGLAKVEQHKVPDEKAIRFLVDGKLKVRDAKLAQKKDTMEVANQASEAFSTIATNDKFKAFRTLTPEEELAIGREVAANVIAQFGLSKNDAVTEYVNLVGLNVARAAERKNVNWHFAVLDSDIVNAFAVPGGFVFVTKGLLKSLQSEAQLACVLGHEVTHISENHVLKEIQRNRLVSAAIPENVRATAEKSPWMNEVSNFAVQIMYKGLSREDELESDREGLILAYDTGYDPKAFKEVLNILKEKSHGASKNTMKFLLSTHPKPEDRLAGIDERLAIFPDAGETLPERYKKNLTSL